MRTMHWSKRLIAVLLFVPLTLVSGCLDYESGVSFNKDLSGKATFKMVMDMESFVMQMVKAMAGATGEEPPAEFLPMMKAEISKQIGSTGIFNVEEMKAKLPAGVTLADSVQKAEELKLTMAFTFAFTDINKLALIEIPLPAQAKQVAGGTQTPLKPFDFVIKDDGTTITITTRAAEKAADKPAAADEKTKAEALAAVKEAKSQLDQLGLSEMLKGASIRVQMRFDIPQTVVEQNATRKDGQSYFWEMKMDSLDSLDKMPEPPLMKLKFNKK